jgi:paired amphipathic helix protein Sin3a
MKEFKSQAIDTPGVIQRVSTLFRGHPELIVGFNTFLPPGYKIEMHANEQVSVSMPSSTVIIQSGGAMTTTLHPPSNAIPIHITPAGNAQIHSNQSKGQQQHVITNAVNNLSSSHGVVTSGKASSYPSSSGKTLSMTENSSNSHHLTNSSPHHPLGLNSGITNGGASSQQPVEFNHAITYVNKIKSRFQGQPDVYKQFLEILHTYQKEQKTKDGKTPDRTSLTESEVYAQVAKLFQNQEDLLAEFGQFLPDANSGSSIGSFNLGGGPSFPAGSGVSAALSAAQHVDNLAAAHRAANNDHGAIVKKPLSRPGILSSQPPAAIQVKRLPSSQVSSYPGMNKRIRMTSLKDVSLADAGRHGSLNEFAFFDKVRKALKSQDIYENFLRCLVMYNHEIISRMELVQVVTPFLAKFPELLKWFKEFVGHKEGQTALVNNHNHAFEGLANRVGQLRTDRERENRITSDTGMEIDYATCKRYGASYRALPKNYPQPKCSGRTPLCREVLNDTWVSFPSWSEDSTFVTSKKTQYEEYISKCEDERYELDVVIETNLVTIRILEALDKKLSRMTQDERSKFKLDDHLGGTSNTIHQRAIKRIYGDKAQEIIDGLKKNPVVAVPIVLRRLKMKEEEWREAQKSFNKIWREQNERYYLKSLDHQGISFKQNDIKFLRSKNLLNEIETLFEERHDSNEEPNIQEAPSMTSGLSGPHLTLRYKDKAMIDEACSLIIHHIKRQTSIHKEDKHRIKQLMRQFVPDLFSTPRGELSDDEMDVDDDFDREDPITSSVTQRRSDAANINRLATEVSKSTEKEQTKSRTGSPSVPSSSQEYSLFFCNNNWYLFFRLHNILCDRLAKMYDRSQIIVAEEAKEKSNRKESTAIALRLKPKSKFSCAKVNRSNHIFCNTTDEIEVEEYFPVFVDMIKQVLDGNLDGNQYEDVLREMFGIHAYIGFTMDKVVQNICRQLQHIVGDENCNCCATIYSEELKSSGGLATGGSVETQASRSVQEALYQKRIEEILEDENCFKIMFYKEEGKVTIELLDTESDESEYGGEIERWSEYIEKYVRDDCSISEELKERLCKSRPVFLPRNIPVWRRKALLETEQQSQQKEGGSDQSTSRNNNNNDKSEEDRETEEKMDVDHSPVKETEETLESKVSTPSTEDAKETPPSSSSNNNGSNEATVSADESILKDLQISDNTQCRFNVNSFKMLFVIGCQGHYLYRKNSIPKARKVSYYK